MGGDSACGPPAPGPTSSPTVCRPGLVTGASDDDPSGIATYSQAGAKFGVGFLWTALLTLPLMATVQEICERTALATGAGLGELAVKRFNRVGRMAVAVLVAALIVANALNIAADLVAVGTGMNLLHAGPAALWAAIVGLAITAVLMVGSFSRIVLVFKILCAALLSYIVVMFTVTGNWSSVASHTFIPTCQRQGRTHNRLDHHRRHGRRRGGQVRHWRGQPLNRSKSSDDGPFMHETPPWRTVGFWPCHRRGIVWVFGQ